MLPSFGRNSCVTLPDLRVVDFHKKDVPLVESEASKLVSLVTVLYVYRIFSTRH